MIVVRDPVRTNGKKWPSVRLISGKSLCYLHIFRRIFFQFQYIIRCQVENNKENIDNQDHLSVVIIIDFKLYASNF